MLDAMRRHSRSLIIYVIFGILIAVFIISFGPQSGQTGAGCMPRSSYAAKVGGRTISEHSWRFYMNARGMPTAANDLTQRRRREEVMDKLIERELLAQAAEEAGFTLSDAGVEARIAKGEFYLLGMRFPEEFGIPYFVDGRFDYDALHTYAQRLGLPDVNHFVDEQRREMLAQRMRELLEESVRVSPEEVLERYKRDHDKVWLEYVKFEPRKYRQKIELSDADLDAYVQANEATLKKQFEADQALYTGRGDWVRVRAIYVESPRKLKARQEVGETGEAPPADDLPDPARADAEAALNRVKGGEDFAKVAREQSAHKESARRGGLMDWAPVTGLGLGAEVTQAIEALAAGQMTDVVETATGYYVVRVEERHQGDLGFDQVKRDLAWDAAREDRAKAKAKSDAEAAFAAVQGGAPLEQLFPREYGEPTENPAPATPRDPDAPKLMETGSVKRNGAIVASESSAKYVGKSIELAKAVFGGIAPGQVGPKVYEVEDGFVIVRVVKREEPDVAEFEKEKDELAESFAFEKAIQLLDVWTSRRCLTARSAGEIHVNPSFIEWTDAQGKTRRSTYQPCTSAAGAQFAAFE